MLQQQQRRKHLAALAADRVHRPWNPTTKHAFLFISWPLKYCLGSKQCANSWRGNVTVPVHVSLWSMHACWAVHLLPSLKKSDQMRPRQNQAFCTTHIISKTRKPDLVKSRKRIIVARIALSQTTYTYSRGISV